MNTPKITIIIPIYNAGRVLRQCVDSCLAQTMQEIEVILVNDASTDNSLSVCEEYAARDSRVVLINKTQNEGVDAARFSAMAVATGQYLTFVDADDWLSRADVLSQMYATAEATGADYVEVGTNRVIGSRGWIKRASVSPVLGLITQPDLFDKYYISFFGVNILSVLMWGKLYRKSVVDNAKIKPTGLKRGQDLAFNMQIFPHLKSIYLSNIVGYNYRWGGLTSKYNPNFLSIYKSLYILKEGLIEKYQYYRATDFLHMEAKNVLRESICQAIIFGNGTREEIIESVRHELQDPIYERILHPYDHPQFYEQPFVMALVAKDVEAMYEECATTVRKERPKRMIKKVANYLLR